MSIEGAVPHGRLGELYLTYAAPSIRLAYLLTGDAAVAEDLVQDAFARVIGRLGHLREAAAFEPYLRRTVVNLSRNYFRRRAVERAWLAREAARPQRPAVQPDVAVTESVRRALARVPSRQRAALVLRYYEDLSEEQCASILQCRPGTVRSLVSRGMDSLRTQLAGDDNE